jgi:hypothetical protein
LKALEWAGVLTCQNRITRMSKRCSTTRASRKSDFVNNFWRAFALGNVAQIDPDASPVGRAAAHRVDGAKPTVGIPVAERLNSTLTGH